MAHHLVKNINIPFISTINSYISNTMLIVIEINILLIYISFLNDTLFALKLIILAVIILISLFVDYFMMPNRNINDFHFTTETSFIILFRCSFVLVIIFSLAHYYDSQGFLEAIVSVFTNIVLIYSYYRKGGMLYHHQISSVCFNINFSLLVTINTTILLELFENFALLAIIIIFFLALFLIY